MITVEYNRQNAVLYAKKWALLRNHEYYNFDNIGGDCTNFVSQCIYAGSEIMNYTNVFGWFYIDASNRTASWTGVEFLYNFLISNKSVGPFAVETNQSLVTTGDIIQLGDQNRRFYHSLIVLDNNSVNTFVAAHSTNAINTPLSDYSFYTARFLHIKGVRKWL
ncbi:MAG: amidase domain-containing protein [Clostridia bacterium]|nr:amidase domain-containing protein [Clostridia bacterium]